MTDDLAYHPDKCTCPVHASIRRFLFDFEPTVHPDVTAIPAHRVNAYCERLAATGPELGPPGTPQLGDEFDTHGAGSMYRAEGMWVWDGIGHRQNRKP